LNACEFFFIRIREYSSVQEAFVETVKKRKEKKRKEKKRKEKKRKEKKRNRALRSLQMVRGIFCE
jgi:hypothetical protein